MPTVLRTIYKVIYDAVFHFVEDDGFAMASHVALSTLLAVFPFLIFGTALASFLGASQFSSTAVHLIFDTWPETIAKPLADEIEEAAGQIGTTPFAVAGIHVEGEEGIPVMARDLGAGQLFQGEAVIGDGGALLADRLALA